MSKRRNRFVMGENDKESGAHFKSGFVSVVGRPNVGKSTLINTLTGVKVSIISDKPQTTRNNIRGILNGERMQIIFVDTPGIHKPKSALGENMNRQAAETLKDADAILFLVDASSSVGKGDLFISAKLREMKAPKILIMNKIDRLGNEELIIKKEEVRQLGNYEGIFAVSASKSIGIDPLIQEIFELLPNGPMYYPKDEVSDQPLPFSVAELIREKVLHLTREEVPHGVNVIVDELNKRPDSDLFDIRAVIYVERDSQKGIIIGKGGKMLKKIGSMARAEIEPLIGSRVFLEIFVKVEKDWTKNPRAVKRMWQQNYLT